MKIKILSINSNNNFNDLLKNFFLINHKLLVDIYFISDFNTAFESYQNTIHDIIFINIDISPQECFEFLNYVDFFDPFIVFVSENEGFALKSNDYKSTYYLLSNYDSKQLNLSFQKIFSRVHNHKLNLSVINNLNSDYGDYLTVTSTKRIDVLRINDIVYLEADGRYTHIYTKNGLSKIAVKNLGEVEKKLDPKKFCRVHHKYLINVFYLESIYKSDGLYCEMITKVNVPISKRKYEDLNRFLNIGNTIKLIE
jgi:two-component system LytT family response regulator